MANTRSAWNRPNGSALASRSGPTVWMPHGREHSVRYVRRRRRPDLRNETDFRQGSRLPEATSALDAVPDSAVGPEEVLEHRALVAALRECVQELPEELRTLCELLFEQGMKQTEAATILQLSTPTLTRRKQEACELLRRCLARKGVTDTLPG